MILGSRAQWTERLTAARHTINSFFGRPWGGMEVEMIVSTAEIGQAFLLFLMPDALWQTRSFQDFVYWGIPAWAVGTPWAVASVISWIGIVLALAHRKACAPLRWAGSFLSTLLWGWVAIKTGIVSDWSIVYVLICFLFSVWSIRISTAALSRWNPRHTRPLQ